MTTKKLTDYIKQSASMQTTEKTGQPKPAQARIQFKKETEFQETPMGKIPKKWHIVKLCQVAILKNGQRPQLVENGHFPVYGANGVMGSTNQYLVDSDYTLIIGRVGAAGQVHLARGRIWVSDNAIYTENYDKNKVFLPYLYYLLITKRLERCTLKTTHPIITQTFVKNILVPLPSTDEQKVIAEILFTVGSAIDRVRGLVERAEKLKKGLMQELFTKGIGHKEYKETPIGRVPNEWLVYRLGQLAIEMYYGVTAKAVEHYTGTRFLRTTDIKDYKVEWDSLPYCEVTSNNKVNLSKYTLRKGDIIVSRAGTVGMSVYVDRDMPDTVFGSYLIKIRVNDKLIDPKFLHYYLQTEQYWIQILASSKGSTLKNISLPTLKSLVIPVPTLEEQKVIIEILSTVDRYVESIKMRLERLERVKKWLMDVLLTGKVRVIVEPSSGGSSG